MHFFFSCRRYSQVRLNYIAYLTRPLEYYPQQLMFPFSLSSFFLASYDRKILTIIWAEGGETYVTYCSAGEQSTCNARVRPTISILSGVCTGFIPQVLQLDNKWKGTNSVWSRTGLRRVIICACILTGHQASNWRLFRELQHSKTNIELKLFIGSRNKMSS